MSAPFHSPGSGETTFISKNTARLKAAVALLTSFPGAKAKRDSSLKHRAMENRTSTASRARQRAAGRPRTPFVPQGKRDSAQNDLQCVSLKLGHYVALGMGQFEFWLFVSRSKKFKLTHYRGSVDILPEMDAGGDRGFRRGRRQATRLARGASTWRTMQLIPR